MMAGDVGSQPELQSNFVSQMAVLLLCNVLWSGLGNLAIGDKRGWALGFINWIAFALSFLMVGVPSVLFFAYCGFVGYQFLQQKQQTEPLSSGTSLGLR